MLHSRMMMKELTKLPRSQFRDRESNPINQLSSIHPCNALPTAGITPHATGAGLKMAKLIILRLRVKPKLFLLPKQSSFQGNRSTDICLLMQGLGRLPIPGFLRHELGKAHNEKEKWLLTFACIRRPCVRPSGPSRCRPCQGCKPARSRSRT